MQFSLFNTLRGKLEPFKPVDKSKVNLYTCGPTVYNYAHIGNLRAYISADILNRALRFNGFNVDWVMNITDVDDKTIANTIAEFGQNADAADLEKFTQKYYELFLEDLKKINIETKDIAFIKVSEKITDIQLFILELIKKGYAYKAEDDSTYFSIQRYQENIGDYGTLVGAKFIEGKKIGARVKVDEYDKEDLSDFALWKSHTANDGQIYWDHPELGKGRPGWHIECTVINYFKFPNGTDIHTGGIDLIFPHHTNEIAQAQSIYQPFVNYWMHSDHIMVDGKKMSKSAGNFFTLNDLIEKKICSGNDLRYLYLQSHYKSRLNVTMQSLAAAKEGLQKLKKTIGAISHKDLSNTTLPDSTFIDKFTSALNNDLNTPEALAILHEVIASSLENEVKLATVYKMDEALGLNLQNTAITEKPLDINNLDEHIKQIIRKRDIARQNKDYATSDQLRNELEQLGYEVMDSPAGTLIINNHN